MAWLLYYHRDAANLYCFDKDTVSHHGQHFTGENSLLARKWPYDNLLCRRIIGDALVVVHTIFTDSALRSVGRLPSRGAFLRVSREWWTQRRSGAAA